MRVTITVLLPLLAATAIGSDPAEPSRPLGVVVDFPMDDDPPPPTVVTVPRLHPGLKPLWFAALAGPEAELKMRAAEAVAEARRRGLDDMADAAPHLLKVLDEEHTLPVRLAIARALIVTEARQAAPVLFAQAEKRELDMRQLVEPALAAWNHGPARSVWLARLGSPDSSHQTRLLTVRCLGATREPAAVRGLRSLIEDHDRAAVLRLEAARALAAIEPAAAQRASDVLLSVNAPAGTIDRLVAASLLQTGSDGTAKTLLERLSRDEEPAVAALAYGRLLEVDAMAATALAGRLVDSPDAKVRHLAARSLEAIPSRDGVATLGPLLDDPHPDVRIHVRDALFRLAAKPDLDASVRAAGEKVLSGEGWRGLEQSALLLGALDHEVSADRIIALLEHPRPEVTAAAAWSLRRLAVPGTLNAALEVAKRRTARLLDGTAVPDQNETSAQLFHMFAEMDYGQAESILREQVPKRTVLGDRARTAAVWALGHFHTDDPEPKIVAELEARLSDAASIPPESGAVRRMAAATLGRMGARESLPTLKKYFAPLGAYEPVSGACNWAVTRLTGEAFPDAPPTETGESGWFLEPL